MTVDPIHAFFAAIAGGEFVEIVTGLLRGSGPVVRGGAGCAFLDGTRGVVFVHAGKTVVVDPATFLHYVERACASHVLSHPQDETTLTSHLRRAFQRGQAA